MAMPFTQFLEVGDVLIHYGLTNKTSVDLAIEFKPQFKGTPAVSVTPFWEDQHSGVGHAETIEEIAANFFRLCSNNAASNYYVSWIAIGKK